uniref:Uncharacterized protein n=1 Tax=Cyprinus carpio TaxID=7962 RepID=A0A8C1PFG2_CYPCA
MFSELWCACANQRVPDGFPQAKGGAEESGAGGDEEQAEGGAEARQRRGESVMKVMMMMMMMKQLLTALIFLQRHKEYLKMLQERRQALDEADELVDAITATKESIQYDHPNHTVTVTTISDLDLSADRLLETDKRDEERKEEDGEKIQALPRTAGNPLMSEKIQRLTASLNSLKKQKKRRRKWKPKQEVRRGSHQSDWKSSSFTNNKKLRKGKSTKAQRRKRTGRNERNQD